ncbi:MAG: TonB family protein [Bacteroidota bacterium]|nr:TonB family protein [Bacteroidota bacterium]
MTSQQILQSDFLDILFEKRNKAYGAYALRRSYHSEMAKALTISISVVFLCLFFINPPLTSLIKEKDNSGIVMRELKMAEILKPKEKPVKPALSKMPQVKQQQFLTFKLVAKEVQPLATQDVLNHAEVSNITATGIEIMGIIPPVKIAEMGNGASTKETEKSVEAAPDKQPQFPGGMKAWLAFLNNNLRAPKDLESGEKRIVNIRFHVDIDGAITNFQIMQSGGADFDNEVIRVLKKMPKWMPAFQSGKPMAVSFTQPVTFVGTEE